MYEFKGQDWMTCLVFKIYFFQRNVKWGLEKKRQEKDKEEEEKKNNGEKIYQFKKYTFLFFRYRTIYQYFYRKKICIYTKSCNNMGKTLNLYVCTIYIFIIFLVFVLPR